MKRFAVQVFLCSLTLMLVGGSAQVAQTDQQQIEELEQQFRSDPHDVVPPEFVNKNVAENYVWMMPGGELGRSELTRSDPGRGQNVENTKIKDLKVHVMGEMAIADGFWSKRTKDNEGNNAQAREWKGIFQDIWIKESGTWKLIASATSPYHVKMLENGSRK